MDRNDQQAIDGLFQRLSEAERSMPQRDAGADSFIAARVAEQPAAPYYMAQTIVMQQAALEQAQARIEDLESRPQQGGGGFLSGLFGGGAQRPAPRRAGGYAAGPASAAMQQQRMAGGQQGGGFLAGAAQTAMGVAGGMMLASAISGMFAGEAEAGEAPVEEEPQDEGFADMGEDMDMDF